MPELIWNGKEETVKAAGRLPYRLLTEDRSLSYGADGDNMLIQGDNLSALKSLLPYYKGLVRCVFIDPPYNTKSAFEHYDDNMEHSIWLSTIYPRLELLREFLTEDGSIWITVDDNEGQYLKVICDEIFGRNNFITTITWQSRYSRSNDAAVSLSHNYIYVYAVNPDVWKKARNRLPRTEAQSKQYKNPDKDPNGPWRAIPWDAPNIRPNLTYPIINLKGNVKMPPTGRCWSRTEDQWLDIVREGRAYFGKSGDGMPSVKSYLKDAPPIVPNTWWPHDEAGHTDEAQKEIIALFGKDNTFETPKPERLLQRILQIATNEGDLVLDSFLGSGTTAAVAHKMNRRYIGIEMGDHAITHCVPRLQKVVDGELGGISKAVNWQGGGGFRFYRLGETLFDEYDIIRPDINFLELAAHIWFTETKRPYSGDGKSPLLGVHNGTAYYLLYNGILGDKKPQSGNVLSRKVMSILPPYDGPKVIYGERTLFGAAKMQQLQITFKHIPTEIKVY